MNDDQSGTDGNNRGSKRNSYGVAGFIFSLVGVLLVATVFFTFFGVILSVFGIAISFWGIDKAKEDPTVGRGLAVAGIVLGAIGAIPGIILYLYVLLG